MAQALAPIPDFQLEPRPKYFSGGKGHAVASDGMTFATGEIFGAGLKLKIWDRSKGLRHEIHVPQALETYQFLEFSPDGMQLVHVNHVKNQSKEVTVYEV